MNNPLTCGVCGEPIPADGSGAVIARTAGVAWQWVHDSPCASQLQCSTDRAPDTASARGDVREQLERARHAGRIRETWR
jgi:hypothetical protein